MHDIKKPTLVVNEAICRSNIKRMVEKAKKSNAILRPHFKTHQSKEVGEWFRESGITKITTSSIEMATYFADCGWKDITIAFPYNLREWKEINELAKRVHLNVVIVSIDSLAHLISHVTTPLSYWIKIDVGTGRTGLLPDQEEEILKLAKGHVHHRFEGLLCHAGHSYNPLDVQKAKEIFESSLSILQSLKRQIGVHTKISYGDTPTCSLLDDFPGVDELRPGNFAFFDTMQHAFGVCGLEEIAVCMICPVVSIHPERNEVVIYGGGVHFSKDFIRTESTKFGTVVRLTENGWNPKSIGGMVRLSQEHGIVRLDGEGIKRVKVGDLLGVLPVHSCLTADLQGYYLSLTGQKLTKLNRSL